MSAEQKIWRFDKTPANFKLYDDFDDGNLTGWSVDGDVSISSETFDGTGYSVQVGTGVGYGTLSKTSLGWSSYDDIYLVITLYVVSEDPTTKTALILSIDTPTGIIKYYFGTSPTGGDINISLNVGVWYSFVLSISDDFYNKYGSYPAVDIVELYADNSDIQVRVDWIGIFRESAFSDDYCISCKTGFANNVDSAIRDTDSDDVYLKTTNSDLQITEDVPVDSNNSKLTIYGTLGEGMRLKVTVSWEIGGVAQTDKVLYADTLPYSWDLAVECPNIDKVTNIKIENILAP